MKDDRPKGSRISLTAFEVQWLYLIADTNTTEACEAALPHFKEVGSVPARVRKDPYAAWDRILDKLNGTHMKRRTRR